jgi:hypothetical protein
VTVRGSQRPRWSTTACAGPALIDSGGLISPSTSDQRSKTYYGGQTPALDRVEQPLIVNLVLVRVGDREVLDG